MDRVATSFLFTNFPPEEKTGVLWKTFAKYGKVGEVYIPKKLNKWGKKFGFVKFKDVEDSEELEGKLKNVRCGDFRLWINLARFGREVSRLKEQESFRRTDVNSARVVNGKSFMEAMVLGTSKVMIAEPEKPSMEVYLQEEIMEEISRSFVCTLHLPRDTKMVGTSLEMEGWSGIKVALMGDNMVPLTSEEVGVIEKAITEKNSGGMKTLL